MIKLRVHCPETLFDAVANVSVKNGRIAAITTEQISGRETIDASGLPASQIDAH